MRRTLCLILALELVTLTATAGQRSPTCSPPSTPEQPSQPPSPPSSRPPVSVGAPTSAPSARSNDAPCSGTWFWQAQNERCRVDFSDRIRGDENRHAPETTGSVKRGAVVRARG